jgi:hypothetical protein
MENTMELRDALATLVEEGLVTTDQVKEYIGIDLEEVPEAAQKVCDPLHTMLSTGADTYRDEITYTNTWYKNCHQYWLSYAMTLKEELHIPTWEKFLSELSIAIRELKHIATNTPTVLELLLTLLDAHIHCIKAPIGVPPTSLQEPSASQNLSLESYPTDSPSLLQECQETAEPVQDESQERQNQDDN